MSEGTREEEKEMQTKGKEKKKTFPACPAPSSSLSGGNEGLWKCIKCKERRETDRQGGGGGGEDGGGRGEGGGGGRDAIGRAFSHQA